MKWKFFNLIALPFLLMSTITPLEIISSENSKVYKEEKDNPNNHEMVDYELGNSIIITNSVFFLYVEESALGQFIWTNDGTIDVPLKPEYSYSDFSADNSSVYFTLYDTTDSEIVPIETIEGTKEDNNYWLSHKTLEGDVPQDEMIFNISNIIFKSKLEDYHQYRMGFNIEKDDELMAYSDVVQLAVPQLANFSSIPDEESITINYQLKSSNPDSSVTFDYNEIYLKVDKRKIDLNNETSGQVVIDNLRPAREYDISIGYDATKIVSETNQYNISHEFDLEVSTLMPLNYGTEVITIAFILLILLIIIILILIIIILYWNHQRRQISGMALVVGEDTQAYDPVYQHNYYQQEDEAGVPNATSSNQGNEVYGYFDEVQDNQEEPYGYFDEVQDEYYQDEEIAGYFDEVQEDYYEDDVYDIDHSDEGEWF